MTQQLATEYVATYTSQHVLEKLGTDEEATLLGALSMNSCPNPFWVLKGIVDSYERDVMDDPEFPEMIANQYAESNAVAEYYGLDGYGNVLEAYLLQWYRVPGFAS